MLAEKLEVVRDTISALWFQRMSMGGVNMLTRQQQEGGENGVRLGYKLLSSWTFRILLSKDVSTVYYPGSPHNRTNWISPQMLGLSMQRMPQGGWGYKLNTWNISADQTGLTVHCL